MNYVKKKFDYKMKKKLKSGAEKKWNESQINYANSLLKDYGIKLRK